MTQVQKPKQITLTYTNDRGEKSVRTIQPMRVWFGATEYHSDPQWLLECFDVEKGAHRDYALKDCDFTKTA